MISGLVVVDKPAGMTSHDVVGRCRRIFGQKRVGHAGTLDPDATGVLLVGLGQATRLLTYMSGLDKSYDGEIVLGVATSTLDASGDVIGTWDMSAVGLDAARAAAASLTGAIQQVPPMVSAVKVGGERLYKLARAGVEVERRPRSVTVSRFDLASGSVPGVLRASIDCSSGTYIRVLASDLGSLLGGGAHLRGLRRTAVGPWSVTSAVPLDSVGAGAVIAPAESLPWLTSLTVSVEVAALIANGRVLEAAAIGANGDGPWRVLSGEGELLAVYGWHTEGHVKPQVVLAQPVT